eukprot:640054_1
MQSKTCSCTIHHTVFQLGSYQTITISMSGVNVSDKTNEISSGSSSPSDQCSITISMSGINVSLTLDSNPPKAEELFASMFFEEELPKAPTHYRQQRWNKRRIQKRWNWKRGREREIYEKRAEFLQNKWLEMKKDFAANKNGKLSKHFLDKNRNLKIEFDENDVMEITNDSSLLHDTRTDSPHSAHDTDQDGDVDRFNSALSSNDEVNTNMKQTSLPSNKVNKSSKNNTLANKKMEGKRKHIRRREKLIERIANGETLEDFVDHQKLNNIYKNVDNEKDNLLFGGTQSNNKKTKSKSKTKKSKKQKRNKNHVVAPMKLAEFVEAAKQFTVHNNRKSDHKMNSKKSGSRHRNDVSVSLDDIQAEQTKDFEAFTRRKRDEIHGMAQNESQLFANKVKAACGGNATSVATRKVSDSVCGEMLMPCDVNRLLMDYMKITNYDDMAFRNKIIDQIYCGCSVFSCIPCCVEASNTLLVEASFIERLLIPHASLSNLSGLFELKKRLQIETCTHNIAIEVLPIFEKAYLDKQCVEMLLIQFQDVEREHDVDACVKCALSLYQCWRQEGKNVRIQFVEHWFGKAYVLQHSHLWSDIALASNITIYDNNSNYIRNINKTARHCRCSFKRVIYFPPFTNHATNHHNAQLNMHGTNCIQSCCCCVFYCDEKDEAALPQEMISNGDTVLWNGRKCIAHSQVPHSNQEYKVQIDPINTTKYVVALSSLQRIKKNDNLKTNQAAFDAQKHIADDLSFVLYVKKFWNIL